MRALLMPVGDEGYAIAIDRVREITTDPRPTRLPGVPAGVLGVINLRGEVVPVFDTATLLGLDAWAPPSPADAAGSSRFAVVVQSPLGPAALTATATPEVVTLGDDLGPSDLPGASGRYRLGSRLVVMLDTDAILEIVRGENVLAGGV